MRADINAILARARLKPPGDVIETVSIVATLALLQGSDAVAVLPVDLARHYAEHGLLARLPLALPAGGGVTQLLTRANRLLAPVAQEFVATLTRLAASPARPATQRRARRTPRLHRIGA
jgi:DNA-binding transcriptional LysR family regulator